MTTQDDEEKDVNNEAALDSRTNHFPMEVEFHFVKSEFFRVIHVDGAHGGPTPQGLIHMALYSERTPIPRQIVNHVSADGTVGREVSRDSRNGVYREVEASAIMSLDVARALHHWLETHIERMDALRAQDEES